MGDKLFIDWNLIKTGCPHCGAKPGGEKGLHWHGRSVWCLGCGWSMNWELRTEEARADG